MTTDLLQNSKIFFLFIYIGTDGSIDYCILRLPTRYPFLYTYLVFLCICIVLALPWLMSAVLFIVQLIWNRLLGRKRCIVITKPKEL